MAISSISSTPILPVTPLGPAASSKTTGATGGFGGALESAIGRLEQMRGQAEDAVQKLLTGEGGELHTAALAAQRAEIAFDLGLQVRNKIVQAYQEVMRMQL